MAVITKNRKLHRILIPLLIVLALTVVLGAFGGAYAKYIREEKVAEEQVSSKNMYFASDYLTEQGAAYTIWGNSVTIQLRNYPDALRESELDVNYRVSVDNGATVKIGDQAPTSGPLEGTLTAGSRQTVNVVISGMQPGQTYTVVATGSNGFSTTLSATFTVQAAENGVFMSMEQTEYYVLLTVWTQNVSGGDQGAKIIVPAGLLPDNTDPIMQNVTAGSSYFTDTESFDNPYSSKTYRFFKQTTGANFQLAQFTGVKVGNVVALPGTD